MEATAERVTTSAANDKSQHWRPVTRDELRPGMLAIDAGGLDGMAVTILAVGDDSAFCRAMGIKGEISVDFPDLRLPAEMPVQSPADEAGPKETQVDRISGAAHARGPVSVEWVKATDRPDMLVPGAFVHNSREEEAGVVLFANDTIALLSTAKTVDYAANIDALQIPIITGEPRRHAGPPTPKAAGPAKPGTVDLYRLLSLIVEVGEMLDNAASPADPDNADGPWQLQTAVLIADQPITATFEKSKSEWANIKESVTALQFEVENMIGMAATRSAYAQVQGGAA